MVPAGAALMHALARLRVIPWKLACTTCCTARLQSSVDEFRSQDFGLKLNWEAPMGSDLVYSILSPEWNADRPASTRFVIGLQSHACSVESILQVGVYGGGWIGFGHEDSSHNILTLDALQVV
jgi:hypothetical protein